MMEHFLRSSLEASVYLYIKRSDGGRKQENDRSLHSLP
ncbi:hypothetical protein B4135_0128 [Caldibacillus debilis]|uniref:Uncharacterized protein n=1 Tax=Caldibacillus debilis TaxID=301148 RepID=A0A150M538_9BACI|nr:hypothetical protein B4135_0128 [Caldibacillus debilis]